MKNVITNVSYPYQNTDECDAGGNIGRAVRETDHGAAQGNDENGDKGAFDDLFSPTPGDPQPKHAKRATQYGHDKINGYPGTRRRGYRGKRCCQHVTTEIKHVWEGGGKSGTIVEQRSL